MLQLIPLFAAFAPFLLWPIELVLPYPFIIEELAKLLLLIPVLKLKDRNRQIKFATIIGVLFAISESVLYLFNIYLVGNISTLGERLLLTIPLHVITTLLILVPTTFNKKLLIPGLILAMLVHYFFNLAV